jgi:hypothetical protein
MRTGVDGVQLAGRSPRRTTERSEVHGTVSTHCLKGLGGRTHSTKFAAVDAIRRPKHEGHNPRPLHEKETSPICT